MIVADWERWIVASLFKFVKDRTDAFSPPYHVFIEGTQRKTSEHPAYLEMRIDGPSYKLWQGFTRVIVQLNIEISYQKDRKLYAQNLISGRVAGIMDNYVAVFKLGSEPGDDGSQIGCLRVDDKIGVVAHKYGQIQPATMLLQGTIEASYWIDLEV